MSFPNNLLAPSTLGALCCLAFLYLLFIKKQRTNLLPSPKGLPLIGHLHLMPPKRPWIWFDKLGQQFDSPLVYLNLAGQDVVIVNDYAAGIELLEKRAANYSSRPRLVVADDYASPNKRLLFLPYGDTWRQHRSAFQREMTLQKSRAYVPIQTSETKLLMRDVLRTPAKFMDHFRQYSANVGLKISYGMDSEGGNRKIAEVYDVLERMLASANPGAHLVDLLPSLDRLPDALAPWRAAALHQRALNQRVFLGLLRSVREKVAGGELASENAFATRLWEDRERFAMDELDVAYLAGTMLEAGTDTTAAAISTFVLAAISYPDAFNTAQAEVVNACGENPPTMAEFERYEYVRAMCKETLRWRTVTAGGLPHMATTTEDDWYHGMRIPAGAVLIPNHWGMCFNQQTYGQKYDPQLFEPRRWVDRRGGVGEIWEGHAAFGFGRRVCPGRYLAAQSIFLVLANLCYSFDVKTKEGVVVDTYAYTTGFNIEPEHFECSITPRTGIAPSIECEADAAWDALRHL